MTEVIVGKIVAAHGVGGLVKILPFCEDLSLLPKNNTLKLTLKNPIGKYILAEVSGVKDRTTAENLVGTALMLGRSALPPINDPNSYYYDDLIGLQAFDESGAEAGTVIALHDFGAGDLLEIRPPAGEPYLLPFTDHNVPVVDLPNKRLTIRPLEMV